MYNCNYLRRHNSSLVVCSWLVAALPRWMTCATSSFVPNRERLNPVCNHQAEIDCLFRHLPRANYQAAIWKCCFHVRPTVPDPTNCGWIDDDGKLVIHWMRSPPARDAVLALLACKCVLSCKLPKCTSKANGLACTDMCKLQSCSNQKHAAGRWHRRIRWFRRWYGWAGRCLTLMFDHYVWTQLHTRACSRPVVTRNRRKRTASKSMI